MRMKLHGVHAPSRKNTAELTALRLPVPKTVEIPMSMHIGAPAIPVVKPGEAVKVGQLIGQAGGYVSAPIYASVSGTVKKIGQTVTSGGKLMETVVIESDGKQEPLEGIHPPKLDTMQDFLDAVRASGLVGLGGAGFPTVVKLTVKNLEQVKAIIINGAECEPYITSDTRTMLDRSLEVMEGARLVQKFLQVKRVIFAIEDNKPFCVRTYRKLVEDELGMEVCALPSLYPQGGEKVLIYNTMGQIVPEGRLGRRQAQERHRPHRHEDRRRIRGLRRLPRGAEEGALRRADDGHCRAGSRAADPQKHKRHPRHDGGRRCAAHGVCLHPLRKVHRALPAESHALRAGDGV